MRRFKRHPSFERLCDYVDGGEEAPDWRGVRTHLRSCTRCRDEVAWLRLLREETTSLGPVTPPPGTIERVLARRAAGERIILQTHGPVELNETGGPWRGPGGSTGLLIALLSLLAFGGAGVFWVSSAEAGDNNLTFEPHRPAPGQELEIRYVPTTMLAGADSLRLRADFRAAGQPREEAHFPGSRVSVTLRADDDGVFHGTLKLPPVAAYGQMAVEDTQGATVDSNNRRLWEVMTYAGKKPTYEALRQRLAAAEGRDWRRLIETSEEITASYPDKPEGWFQKLAVEMQFGDPTKMDSVLESHRRVLARLEARSAGRDLSAEDIGLLVDYASALGESAAEDFWEASLRRSFPDHPVLLRRRILTLFSSESRQPSAFEEIDNLWKASRPNLNVAQTVFDAAIEQGDFDVAAMWGNRVVELEPEWDNYVGRRLAENDGTRADGIRHLTAGLDRILAARLDMRPLMLTVEEWHREQGRVLQGVVARLSGAFLAEENPTAAAAVLARAYRYGPAPNLVDELAGHALAARDTALALRFLAQAAADPVGNRVASRDRGVALASATGISEDEWGRTVEEARSTLATYTVQASDYLPLKSTVSVRADDGSLVSLRDVVAGGPTLVVSALITPLTVAAQLHEIRDVGIRAAEMDLGFAALLLVRDNLSFPHVVEDAEGIRLYLDATHVAANVLGVWSMLEYLVFDADGVFRGAYYDADQALRLLRFLPPKRFAA